MEHEEINVGDKVRSYDFPMHRDEDGETACYIEGEVTGIEWHEGCDRYVIKATRRVFAGKEVAPESDWFYPPVNGTPCTFGGPTNGVVKMSRCALCGTAYMVNEDHYWHEDYCNELCEENDRAISKADALYDAWKHGDL